MSSPLASDLAAHHRSIAESNKKGMMQGIFTFTGMLAGVGYAIFRRKGVIGYFAYGLFGMAIGGGVGCIIKAFSPLSNPEAPAQEEEKKET